jgi:membrane associated rhomboid family serine protease
MSFIIPFRRAVVGSPLTSGSISSQFQPSSARFLNIIPSHVFRCSKSTAKKGAPPPKPKIVPPPKPKNAPKPGPWRPVSSSVTKEVGPTLIKGLPESSPWRYGEEDFMRKSRERNVPEHQTHKELKAAWEGLSFDQQDEIKESCYEKMPPERRPRMQYLAQTIRVMSVTVSIYCILAMSDAWFQSSTAPEPWPENTAPTTAGITYPQTYFITPTQVVDVTKLGLYDLDPVTVGIVAGMGALALPFSSFFNTKAAYSVSKPAYTLITAAFAHRDWKHCTNSMHHIIWVLPVIRKELDENLYHTSAFVACAASLTCWAQYMYRGFAMTQSTTPYVFMTRGIMGGSGVSCALLGAYCVTHPKEKMVNPMLPIPYFPVQIPIPIRMEVVAIVILGLWFDFRGLLNKTGHRVGHVVCISNTINRKILTSI